MTFNDLVRSEARHLGVPEPADDEAGYLLINLTAFPFNADAATDHADLRSQIRAALSGEVTEATIEAEHQAQWKKAQP